MSDQYEEMHKSHAQRKRAEAASMARDRMNTQDTHKQKAQSTGKPATALRPT